MQYPYKIETIQASGRHTVLYKLPHITIYPIPFRGIKGTDNADPDYVRLPTSSDCFISVAYYGGGKINEGFWRIIHSSLTKNICSSLDLEKAIKRYNEKIGHFQLLHNYFRQHHGESKSFFGDLLKKIIALALELPNLIQAGIPLLKQNKSHSISLSQRQAACLLANAFLCTFPRKNIAERRNYPDINFNRLFESDAPQAEEKLKCILNYFERVLNETSTGVLTFMRRSVDFSDMPKWNFVTDLLASTQLHILNDCSIEDGGIGLLQVDFANKFIGGGVLGRGCVQEEIRFMIFPELILSRLFTESLDDNEALIVIGAERFNKYIGYGSSFKFDGNYYDHTPLDKENNRRHSYMVAIDAQEFPNFSDQYETDSIKRELNKAYVGFFTPTNTTPFGVATGNWGCGAFNGDPQLKALIQLMACTVTKRPLHYFTYEDRKLNSDIYQMYKFLVENTISVAKLYQYLIEYKDKHSSREDLYTYIRRIYSFRGKHLVNEEKKTKERDSTLFAYGENFWDPFSTTYNNSFSSPAGSSIQKNKHRADSLQSKNQQRNSSSQFQLAMRESQSYTQKNTNYQNDEKMEIENSVATKIRMFGEYGSRDRYDLPQPTGDGSLTQQMDYDYQSNENGSTYESPYSKKKFHKR